MLDFILIVLLMDILVLIVWFFAVLNLLFGFGLILLVVTLGGFSWVLILFCL